ncbi:hypothetical protein CC85DRAFT_281945 [Cutaneotrichosporon oleaginosum]|uniref:Protein BCP1 n=1 Tax=Cutaneotrichosporon oleaginosum TaxID=879819 RepID=A0A0J0XZ10_9TREE|nr:uncharacterized protein CC85DRAFT_281945 [Cutaneotrichosporon oleaginosum]KLT46298.1 hypothetical protein CC85DRAFT_281945 [Cutaneotrichosporon oleaginosum]
MPNPQLSAISASQAAKRKSAPRDDEGDSDSDSDVSMIDVDFDFMNLNPDVDQIALKRLLRQTLSHDQHLVDVHPLADLILTEGTRLKAGSTIKTEGEESDPWCLLAAVDVNRCHADPALKPFLTYLLSHNPPVAIKTALEGTGPSTAFLFSLRLLNLPLPLIPPLYKMLGSELGESGATFEQFILWGRGYKLEGKEEAMGLELNTVSKTNKKTKGGVEPLAAGSFPYHQEEEMIEARAKATFTYSLKTAPPRDEESFGVEQFGRLILIDAAKLAQAVEAMEKA